MNKKIKILIVGLVLLMGNSVKADLHNWQYFKSKAGETTPQTINLNQYMNLLIWEENGVVIVNGDHTFVGLSDMLAILDGTNATPLGGFISEKIINFHNNFEFRNFDMGCR